MASVSRVLMIAPTPFFADRGCHVRILEEVRALRRLGIEPTVVTYHLDRDLPDVRIERIPRVPWVRRLGVGPSPHKLYLDLLLLVKTRQVARDLRPELLHAHLHEGAWIGSILRRSLRLPLIADLQGGLAGELLGHGWGSLARLAARFERRIVHAPDALLASSSALARELEETWGVPSERVVTLVDGVDVERFHPHYETDALQRQWGLDGKRVVVFLGVLTPYQGVDWLLDAVPLVARRVPDVHFLLLGYPNEDHYRLLADRRDLRRWVSFPGRVDYALAPRVLCLGQVAVAPKLSLTEANGKVLNYMAAGLPVVASDTPVNRELLGEWGIYASPGDVEGLAQGLVTLLEDEGRARAAGKALRERAEAHYAWSVLAPQIVNLYDRLTSKRV